MKLHILLWRFEEANRILTLILFLPLIPDMNPTTAEAYWKIFKKYNYNI